MPAPKRVRTTRDDLLSLPVLVPLWPTAARVLGIGRVTALNLARTGQLPVPVIQLARRYQVRTADLMTYLGVHPEGVRRD